MNRNELKEIAKIRLDEAQLLLKNKRYDGAYYLCGYVIECALKACIARQTKKFDFPDKKTVNASYSHDLNLLLGIAGLANPNNDERLTNSKLKVNWTIIKDWKAESRYEKHSRKDAEDFYSAITNRKNGALKWIRKFW